MAHAIGVTILAVLTSVLARLLADEFKAWNPKLTDFIVGFAVCRLPKQQKERYSEEWRAHIDDVPGEVAKLCAAMGFVWASVIGTATIERPLVDRKGRLRVPAHFKHVLGEKYGPHFFVTSVDGETAQIYPIEEWERIERKLAQLSSTFNPTKRKFLSRVTYYGQVVEMDGQGRLAIPKLLRESAGLRGEVQVTRVPHRDCNDDRVDDTDIAYLEVRSFSQS
jgi:division/cell wall cluster transcriptional repressor MraZ